MKLKDVKWKAIHFEDRALLPKDEKLYSKEEWNRLLNTNVIAMSTKGHYKAV